MLVVERNTTTTTWGIGSAVNPLKYKGEVLVVMDPSKSNFALLVGTPMGDILNILEFSGNNRKRGPAMNTTQYCAELRAFLKEYLSEANIYMIAMEQTILPKGAKKSYVSNTVLNEIRSNIHSFVFDELHRDVVEINNWAWKAGVLPEGFRGMYDKGSKLYFQKFMPTSPYTYYFEADVTDVICIYWYILKTKCANYTVYCNRSETTDTEYVYCFLPPDSKIAIQGMNDAIYNERFTLEENLNFYVNRLVGDFYMTVPIDKISIPEIYGKSVAFTFNDLDVEEIKVVCKRK